MRRKAFFDCKVISDVSDTHLRCHFESSGLYFLRYCSEARKFPTLLVNSAAARVPIQSWSCYLTQEYLTVYQTSFLCKFKTHVKIYYTSLTGRFVELLKLNRCSSSYVANRIQRSRSGLSTSRNISTQSINLKIVEFGDVTVSNRSITENSWEVTIANATSTAGEMKPIRMEKFGRDWRFAKFPKKIQFSCFVFLNK